MGYHPPKIRDKGLKVWLDSKASKHPRGWGYDDFVYLLKQGQNMTALAQAMNLKTTGAIKEYLQVYSEEQGTSVSA